MPPSKPMGPPGFRVAGPVPMAYFRVTSQGELVPLDRSAEMKFKLGIEVAPETRPGIVEWVTVWFRQPPGSAQVSRKDPVFYVHAIPVRSDGRCNAPPEHPCWNLNPATGDRQAALEAAMATPAVVEYLLRGPFEETSAEA